VTLALERQRLGIAAGFLALPLAMIGVTRGLRLTHRYVPFVIVTNWIAVVGLLTLSFPGLLMLIGWAPSALAGFFTLAFAVLLLRMQWFATKATLGVSGGLAFAIVLLGLGLNAAIAGAMRALIG
jgi:hypothetical protein